ncbi:putative terpene synthase 11 [Senna tora]|uniref:Putative terpene synthase 11 n=1 Tax=Senna tora TaxID=362788 RepID=A0A834SM44_9FABA|nr:putative terpene synthase 11 [Senna tora]
MSATSTIMAISTVQISSRRPYSSCAYHQSPHVCSHNAKPAIALGTSMIKSVGLHHEVSSVETVDCSERLEAVRRRMEGDPRARLEMIDTIQHLGISHHFQQHIHQTLTKMWDWDAGQDLFATALHFRLLRHNGFPTFSPEQVFKKFMDKRGRLKESIRRDTWGMLSLYEASYLGGEGEGEDVLVEAMDFTRAHLHGSIPHLSPELGRHVVNSLRLPRHLRMGRLEAAHYIHEYGNSSNHIHDLLQMAKSDFDMVQSLHQRELAEICRSLLSNNLYYIASFLINTIFSLLCLYIYIYIYIYRWWKQLGLVDKLGFGRDRPSECFLWTVGIFPEPYYSDCRIELTKTICILLIMDDIFDSYGSFNELVLFTEAIKRWDLDAMEEVPEYMRICYMALYNTTNEIAYRVQKEHGLTVVAHLKRTWIDIFEAFLEEARWFNSGHIPSFKEYLENGVTSAGSYMALVHAFFLIGEDLSKENIAKMKPYPRLFSCSGQILRLWDDLGTSREEQERGDNACSIQCYMRENGISEEEEGRKYVRQLIRKLWLELNNFAMASSNALPQSIVRASLNVARTAQMKGEQVQDAEATPSPVCDSDPIPSHSASRS